MCVAMGIVCMSAYVCVCEQIHLTKKVSLDCDIIKTSAATEAELSQESSTSDCQVLNHTVLGWKKRRKHKDNFKQKKTTHTHTHTHTTLRFLPEVNSPSYINMPVSKAEDQLRIPKLSVTCTFNDKFNELKSMATLAFRNS